MEFSRTCEVQFVEDKTQLKAHIQSLLKEASESRMEAYAPYSQFFVGSALLLDDGTVIRGNNQENAAYPSGLCAERVALHTAGSQHKGKKIIALAISVHSDGRLKPADRLVSPCGGCLQVMSEFEKRQNSEMEIIIESSEGAFVAKGVKQFLPFQFNVNL